ncbi:MAG: helix-turn-helix domain-containing protein [Alcanivoracaceae bacterium]
MSALLEQLKIRRKALALRQEDMASRIGMSRQQYQRLEKQGNPRLDTLELLVKGLKGELMFVPHEKIGFVRNLLSSDSGEELSKVLSSAKLPVSEMETSSLADDPWRDILGDLE